MTKSLSMSEAVDLLTVSQAEMIQKEVEECLKLNNLVKAIVQWAEDRNLIEGATRQAQMLKMTEEVGELAAGIAKGKEPEVKDAIGDCFVVLTILAAQSGLTMAECIEAAYNTIKDRKGRMVDGVFVREE